MKILYIDNRKYTHNKDIHIDFFSFLSRKKYHIIHPYGIYLNRYFVNAIIPGKNPNKELRDLVDKIKPDCIITYNCNGSSYELGLDNVNLYRWCDSFLFTTKVPKFHFSTDYCRSGFRKEQGQWFKDLNYRAAFFRHKVSLEYPIDVPAYWVPFSVDRELYERFSIKSIKSKEKSVGFIGAAHNSSKELYANRIAVMDYLMERKQLDVTKVVNPKKFERKLLFNKDYVAFLSRNLFGLTCGGTCQFMTAKHFQIPAAYSMLICAETKGLEVFPEDSYLLYDVNKLDELFEKIVFYQGNLKESKRKISILHEHVMSYHDHHARALELTKIIKAHI